MDVIPGWLRDPDAPPDIPEPRVMSVKPMLPWLFIAAGTLMLLPQLESLIVAKPEAARDPVHVVRVLLGVCPQGCALLGLGLAALSRQQSGLSVKRALLFVAVLVVYVLLDANRAWEAVDVSVRLGALCAMLVVAGLLSRSSGSADSIAAQQEGEQHAKTD
eukprot:CAMPEP_0202863986 /NCGR_PEP_ID=MMETSP1391-20130828/4409_1 /ASSEMBLY_ACC=CAM_ASM_000867 /TAXON_ID=1034604 /ORGANISM="Chlamydomonas leiostraca, Strain SAG 11-49" /LENGTH=160 /DNA_ID=CAMNT_0049543685 /DNA_START=18 /DNA_END=500 /DNA_ORIENTATION=-